MLASFVAWLTGRTGGRMSAAEMAEFRDHPERFRGRTLEAEVAVWTPGEPQAGRRSLRQNAGRPYRFYAPLGGGQLFLAATLPDDPAALPDAVNGVVLLTFVCGLGEREAGNRAVGVRRP